MAFLNMPETEFLPDFLDPGDSWRPLPPAFVGIPGVPHSVYGSIFSDAANLYRLAPWSFFEREVPLAVSIPPDKQQRACVLLGAGGQEFGLLAYDSPAGLRRAKRETDPMKMAREISWLALTYEDPEFLAPQDTESIQVNGWEIAGDGAFPMIARAGAPEADLRAPLAEDLLWLQSALPALTAFYKQYASHTVSGSGSAAGLDPFQYNDADRNVKVALLGGTG